MHNYRYYRYQVKGSNLYEKYQSKISYYPVLRRYSLTRNVDNVYSFESGSKRLNYNAFFDVYFYTSYVSINIYGTFKICGRSGRINYQYAMNDEIKALLRKIKK